MDPFGLPSTSIAATFCSLMAFRAVQKKNLTISGALAGFASGFVLVGCGLRGLTLFCFYQLGSMASKYQMDVKRKQDATLAFHTQRGAVQVLCVSTIATALTIYHAVTIGAEKPFHMAQNPLATRIAAAITAHHATALADTLASELGMLFHRGTQPVLVTNPWRRVPPGTNGGVTIIGLCWSVLGGAVIGLFTIGMDFLSGLRPASYAVQLVAFSATAGLMGSLIDSILGATLQATYWDEGKKLVYHADSTNKPKTALLLCGTNILTNEQVNLVSTAITVGIGGWILAPIMLQ